MDLLAEFFQFLMFEARTHFLTERRADLMTVLTSEEVGEGDRFSTTVLLGVLEELRGVLLLSVSAWCLAIVQIESIVMLFLLSPFDGRSVRRLISATLFDFSFIQAVS